MKKVLFASLAVALLTACSNDDVVQVNNDANAIRFGVTAENNSRAADVFCNANLPGAFNVSAVHGGKLYINEDHIEYKSGKWENTSGLRYWPNEGAVSFYGYVNGDIAWTENLVPMFKDFTVVGDTEDEDGNITSYVASQVDLLYAVKTQSKVNPTKDEAGVTGAVTTPQQVNLNFRHALSQIVFNAKNTNPNLYVEIEGVSVAHVKSKGTYTFPTVDTDNNIPCDGAVDNDAVYQKSTRGTWDGADGKSTLVDPANYSVEFSTVELTGSKEAAAVDLTTANDEGKKFNSLAMLLLPQTTEAISTDKAFEGQTDKTYFLVKCQIWNVADGKKVNKATDVILWGEDGAKDVLLPVSFDWEEGKKYTYTFVFGNGNGGWNPDPEDPTPDPVLVPITFDVTVDEFIPVDAEEVETYSPENNETGDNTGDDTQA